MGHEIDETTGRPGMAYVGDVPWHGLGKRLAPKTTIEGWAEAAGLNWDALLSPVLYRDQTNQIREFDADRILFRSDTRAPLSIVSDNYKVVQPIEVLEFYRDLTEVAGFHLETAGALFGGTKVWALARRDLSWTLGKKDTIKGFLLLATSYDMTLATTAMLTSVRVVCQNTLNLALERAGARAIKIAHNRVFDAEQVKAELGVIDPAWARFKQEVELLAQTKVTGSQPREYFERVLFPKPKREKLSDNQKAQVDRLVNDYRSAPGQDLPTARDTAWGLVNAVTHYFDHTKRALSPEARMDAACFGVAQSVKNRAWDEALALAGSSSA